MRFAFPLMVLTILAAVIMMSHENIPLASDTPDLSLPVYAACTADSDCTLLSLPCGEVGAARQDRRRELQHYYDDVKKRIRCARIAEPQMLKARCVAQRCAALPVPAQEETGAGAAAEETGAGAAAEEMGGGDAP